MEVPREGETLREGAFVRAQLVCETHARWAYVAEVLPFQNPHLHDRDEARVDPFERRGAVTVEAHLTDLATLWVEAAGEGSREHVWVRAAVSRSVGDFCERWMRSSLRSVPPGGVSTLFVARASPGGAVRQEADTLLVWHPAEGDVPGAEIRAMAAALDPEADPAEPPAVRRAGLDYQLAYGDGGRASAEFPAYVTPRLALSERARRRLVAHLTALGDERGDHHAGGPVEDIVDPDLAPRLLDPDEAAALLAAEPEPRRRRRGQGNEEARMVVRRSYTWIPTDVEVVTARGCSEPRVRFLGPIHNLPATRENRPAYEVLARVFRLMLPMWGRLGLVQEGEEGATRRRLQVVFKAQAYNLAPHSSYRGRWHTEGVTEACVAAGVYYAHVADGVEGGALKLRPPLVPERRAYPDIPVDTELEVREGTAAAFSNVLPHRFRTIYNRTGAVARRLFVNFFVIDPARPLPSTTLDAALRRSLRPHLPAVLLDMVSVLAGAGRSSFGGGGGGGGGGRRAAAAAREHRARAKEEMTRCRGRFGSLFYGNSGDTKWLTDCDWAREPPDPGGDDWRPDATTNSAASAGERAEVLPL